MLSGDVIKYLVERESLNAVAEVSRFVDRYLVRHVAPRVCGFSLPFLALVLILQQDPLHGLAETKKRMAEYVDQREFWFLSRTEHHTDRS